MHTIAHQSEASQRVSLHQRLECFQRGIGVHVPDPWFSEPSYRKNRSGMNILVLGYLYLVVRDRPTLILPSLHARGLMHLRRPRPRQRVQKPNVDIEHTYGCHWMPPRRLSQYRIHKWRRFLVGKVWQSLPPDHTVCARYWASGWFILR